MEKKRIELINIKKFICKNDNIDAEIEFNIIHKNSFVLMDRKLTQDKLILKYKDGKITFVITAFKGIEITGFNLKRKHILDIIELLKDLIKDYENIAEVIEKLKSLLVRTKKKNIVCIMGKSGSGKSSAMINLCSKDDNYYMVKSFTTREERINDQNDKLTHIFVDAKTYENDCFDNKVLAVYHSPEKYISWATDECFKEDKINLYAIDYQSYLNFKKRKEYNVIGIYLDINEEERQRRLKKREKNKVYDKEDHLRRFSSSSYCESDVDNCFTISVTNSDIDDVSFLIDDIVKKSNKKIGL